MATSAALEAPHRRLHILLKVPVSGRQAVGGPVMLRFGIDAGWTRVSPR
jgi:hypothetical protein